MNSDHRMLSRDERIAPRMPTPAVYESEIAYAPWNRLLETAAQCVDELAPPNGHVMDYMCGTGYLLNLIHARRPDVSLAGCSLYADYIEYGARRCPVSRLVAMDALQYKMRDIPDVITCTSGLHHLSFDDQRVFLNKVAGEIAEDGVFIVGEVVLRDDSTEARRRLSSLELGTAYLEYIIERDAPSTVIEAAIWILENDLLLRGEYKRSLASLEATLAERFSVVRTIQTWPEAAVPFGDHLLICHPRNDRPSHTMEHD